MSSTKKWIKDVKTNSTSPRESLFTKNARTIARSLASKKVSPEGIGSGINMLQYYINRAGKNFFDSRRKVLEHAKELLQHQREGTKQP